MTRALVTGGSGFIGSHLVELLLSKGYTVRCLLRRTSSTAWLQSHPIEIVYGDVFDRKALADAMRDVQVVYHAAGLTKAKTRDAYYRANVDGTKNVLQAAVDHAPDVKRFIQISSQTAAGPSPTSTPITEDAPCRPITTYGRTKLQAEEACLAYADRIPVTIVRPPAVYGPRDKDIFEFFRTMQKGLQPVVGFGEKYVSLIHVADLVRGIVMAGESEKAVGEIYFISSKDVYGWKRIGEITREVLGRKALTLRIPEAGVYAIATIAEFFAFFSSQPALINLEKAKDMIQNYWTCSAAKAAAHFGYEEQLTVEEGLRNTIQWYRDHGWLKL